MFNFLRKQFSSFTSSLLHLPGIVVLADSKITSDPDFDFNNNKTTKLLDLCTLNICFFIALKKIKNSKLCSSLKKNQTKIKNYSRVFFSRYLLRSEKIPISRFKKNNKHAVVILGLYALCIKTVFMPREYVYFLLSKQPIS